MMYKEDRKRARNQMYEKQVKQRQYCKKPNLQNKLMIINYESPCYTKEKGGVPI